MQCEYGNRSGSRGSLDKCPAGDAGFDIDFSRIGGVFRIGVHGISSVGCCLVVVTGGESAEIRGLLRRVGRLHDVARLSDFIVADDAAELVGTVEC